MKSLSVFLILSLVAALPVVAEPYAEWGVAPDGASLSTINPGMEVPDTSEVPFPPPPGGVFVSVTVASGNCLINMRVKRSVNDVCGFYKSELEAPEYRSVKEAEIEGEPSCAIYKNGNAGHGGVGVTVYKNEDRMLSRNGTTNVLLSYEPLGDGNCDF